jgi:hypothetical protein
MCDHTVLPTYYTEEILMLHLGGVYLWQQLDTGAAIRNFCNATHIYIIMDIMCSIFCTQSIFFEAQ